MAQTLSDKISFVMSTHVADTSGNPIILVSHIKDFIRKLKEWKWEEKRMTSKGMPLIEGQIINDFYDYLDELAGPKLIEVKDE